MDSTEAIDEAVVLNALDPSKDVDGYITSTISICVHVCLTFVPRPPNRVHSFNAGELAKKAPSTNAFTPATPQGCLHLIKSTGTFKMSSCCCTNLLYRRCVRSFDTSGASISGKLAIVIGRSNIVGRPVAQLLLREDATVIMAHSKTDNLQVSNSWKKRTEV
jgi:5,10-methylene-tetrahydrofolate dehydrogenase/methenyl tetrahydrofolate cyclohydrolase